MLVDARVRTPLPPCSRIFKKNNIDPNLNQINGKTLLTWTECDDMADNELLGNEVAYSSNASCYI
jgi:hypothetical protein